VIHIIARPEYIQLFF